MKSKNNFIIDLVVYPFELMVSIGETDDELKEALKSYNVKPTKKSEKFFGFDHLEVAKYCIFENGLGLIRLQKPPRNPEGKGLLSHEVNHYVNKFLNRLGFRWSRDSDEAYCYLTQYLIKEIYKRL